MATESPGWHYLKRGRGRSGGPETITDLSGSASLDGSIVVSATIPAGCEDVVVRYNVDQPAAPTEPYLGIGATVTYPGGGIALVVLTGVEYGASYKFAAWGYKNTQYSAAADTASAAGPLNPLAYSANLPLWLDARREGAYLTGEDVTTPQNFGSGSFALTQATDPRKPEWIEAASGINGMAAFEGLILNARSWQGNDTNMHGTGAGSGLSMACIVTTNAGSGLDKTVVSQWTNGEREWRLEQGTGDFIFALSFDGTAQAGYVQAPSTDGAGPYSLVAVYKQGTGAWMYSMGDGQTDEDLTLGTALYAGTSIMRVMAARGATSDTYDGLMPLLLGYGEPLSRTAAELLDSALADMAGV